MVVHVKSLEMDLTSMAKATVKHDKHDYTSTSGIARNLHMGMAVNVDSLY